MPRSGRRRLSPRLSKAIALFDKPDSCDISPWMRLPPVQPTIPVPRKEPFDDPEWLFEFKYDGYRALTAGPA
jgi:ATP-dependent DNA ligase